MLGVRAFSDLGTPPDVFGPAGHFVALVGLVGLAPVLVDRWPRMSRFAGAVAAVAVVSWAAMTGARLLAVVGAGGTDMLPGGLVALMFVSTVLTYLLFGVGIAWLGEVPLRVGVLVVAPAVLLVVVLAASVVTGVAALAGFVIAVGLFLTMVSLGYTLRTRAGEADHPDRPSDVTVG